jgi:predicted transposase/invertase (TIGR01784 family)
MFDNICKFLAEQFSADFAQWLLGESMPLTELSPSELTLDPIRADSLILLQAEPVVLHIEFQTRPDAAIAFRMLDYSVRIRRRFPEKSQTQVVIYLRESTSPFVNITAFQSENTRHSFQVIRLWECPVATFNTPGLLPFAILGQTRDRPRLLETLAQQIEAIPNRRDRNNIAASTSILAGLVLGNELINRVLRSDIMQESVIYQQILQQGQERGLQQGLEQGERLIITKQLIRRFGELPDTVQQQLQQLAIADLDALGEALLDFSSLDDVETWLQAVSNPSDRASE